MLSFISVSGVTDSWFNFFERVFLQSSLMLCSFLTKVDSLSDDEATAEDVTDKLSESSISSSSSEDDVNSIDSSSSSYSVNG